jgi:hypothetical protein
VGGVLRPVRIEFLPTSSPSRRYWALLALMFVLAAAMVMWAWHQRQLALQLQAELDQAVSARRDRASQPNETSPPPPAYELSARELLRERNHPWPEALEALESVAMQGVTPRAFELLAQEHAVKVEVTAMDQARVLAYIEAANAGNREGLGGLNWTLQSFQADSGGQQIGAHIVGRRLAAEGTK